jgi:hypothetical protein
VLLPAELLHFACVQVVAPVVERSVIDVLNRVLNVAIEVVAHSASDVQDGELVVGADVIYLAIMAAVEHCLEGFGHVCHVHEGTCAAT